jgi:asparagine synthase (glutamine-hydrolysing)
MSLEYVPGQSKMLAGIRKLPAGHFMRCRAGEAPRVEAYWRLGEAVPSAQSSDFMAVMRASVRRQMVSDVPVGAFLSGGVDSSLVVALMAELSPHLETFTAGFADPRLDESPWAERVAKHLGVAHHRVMLDATALDALPDMIWHLDEPVADRAALPTYHLSKLAAKHVKVVLTGEGSDELFAGYPRYRLEQLAQRFHRLPLSERRGLWGAVAALAPAGLRPRLEKLLLSSADPGLRRQSWVANIDAAGRDRLLRPEWRGAVAAPSPDDGSLAAQLLLDLRTWLVDNVLMKVDKMTMAASIEARVPFLDNEVVDWAMGVPDADKLAGGENKALVKRAALSVLPRDVVYRPKQAFHTPTATWFREPRGRELLQDTLLGARARGRGWFDPAEVERLIARHQAGHDGDQALWNMLVLELWQQAYVDARVVA